MTPTRDCPECGSSMRFEPGDTEQTLCGPWKRPAEWFCPDCGCTEDADPEDREYHPDDDEEPNDGTPQ